MKMFKKHVKNMHIEDFSDWHNSPNIFIRIAKSGTCPTCGEEVNAILDKEKCTNCEQRLNWNEEKDTSQLPLTVVVVFILYLWNVVIWTGVIWFFHFLFDTAFALKGIFVLSLVMTILQLLFCRTQE